MVELFPQDKPGLSLDVFLRKEEINKKEMITLSIHGYDGRHVPVRDSNESAEQIAESVQRLLNCIKSNEEPVSEVFFHNSESAPLKEKYQEILAYLKEAQTDTNPARYKITFSQDRPVIVMGH